MGTSALAVAAFRLPSESGMIQQFSHALGWVLLTLAILAMAALIALNLRHRTPRRELWEEIRSAQRGPAYAAIPGAMLTLVLAFESAQPLLAVDRTATWLLLAFILIAGFVDLFLTLVFFAAAIARRGALETDALSGLWFMPQTVLLLTATALARLCQAPNPAVTEIAAPLAVLFLGAGFMLFILIAALVLARLVLDAFDAAAGIPAAWIMMSPAAAAALAFMAIPRVTPALLSSPPLSVSFVTSLFAGALVGFSLWWLAVVVPLTFRLRSDAISFSPASWSYVFPIAAVAVASGELAHTWNSRLMILVAVIMATVAALVWLGVLIASAGWLRARLSGPQTTAQ